MGFFFKDLIAKDGFELLSSRIELTDFLSKSETILSGSLKASLILTTLYCLICPKIVSSCRLQRGDQVICSLVPFLVLNLFTLRLITLLEGFL